MPGRVRRVFTSTIVRYGRTFRLRQAVELMRELECQTLVAGCART
jgi:hypothetical protein